MTEKEREKLYKKKQEYLANEPFKPKSPDSNKIQCKDCKWRIADTSVKSGDGKEITIKGATKGICQIYVKHKPDDVLWHGAECDYYFSEKDDTE